MATDFTDEQQSAFTILSDMLSQYGLSSLSGSVREIILSGITNQNEIQLQLQQTDAWKQRFRGNEMLRQKGLPVLDVSQYLAVESSYAQVMKNYGLPSGFYDDPSDFADFIGNSVSANEINQRAQMYSDVMKREDPAVVEQLQAMGLSKGDIMANMMDPGRALPLIQQKYQTTLLGAAARRAGVVSSIDRLQQLADQGFTEQQAGQAYGQIASQLPNAERLGAIWNETISQADLEAEAFDNNAAAGQKKKRLASQERGAFNGSSGVGQGSLGRTTSGSY